MRILGGEEGGLSLPPTPESLLPVSFLLSLLLLLENYLERRKKNIWKNLCPLRMVWDSEFVGPVSFRIRMSLSWECRRGQITLVRGFQFGVLCSELYNINLGFKVMEMYVYLTTLQMNDLFHKVIIVNVKIFLNHRSSSEIDFRKLILKQKFLTSVH